MTSPAVANAHASVQLGDVVGAARALEHAAANGDGHAAFTLAVWRMTGDPIRRDLAQAREFYGRAAELRIDEADGIYTALLANGAGDTGRRWPEALARLDQRARRDAKARAERDVLRAMALDEEGEPLALPSPTVLNETPLIRSFGGFMTAEECRWLARLARPLFQPATIVDERTGQMVRNPMRTAESAAFPFVTEGPALHAINRRIAAVTGTTYQRGEPVQVLSYLPGQEYKLHNDAVVGMANQRVKTLLVCLEDDFDGGETIFPKLDLSWRGGVGDAIEFTSIDAAGRPDPLTWHAGCPVTRGRKVILSKWIRAEPLDLRGPPGRPL